MKVVIKYFDKDVLKNIMAVLSLRPDKVIFIYDKAITDFGCFYGMKKCFQRHIPSIEMVKYSVNIMNMIEIYEKTLSVIDQKNENYMDLTGGSELMMIAGFRAGAEKQVRLCYTDMIEGVILDLLDNSCLQKTTRITLEDFIDARGACFIGNSHKEPDPKRYRDILEMSHVLFENLSQWQMTSGYLQTVTARYSPHEMHISSGLFVRQKNGREVTANKKIMNAFQKFGFIKNLKITQEHMSFSFSSLADKEYVINYGVWLELFVFISAKQTGAFDDIKLGTMIDWNAYDGNKVSGNEIDVLCSDRSLPIFISCKLRSADTAAINELVIAKKRVGGWFSKGIIVAFGRDKQDNTGTYRRALELGLVLLDAKDIMSPDFGDKLVEAVRGHDLVSLKWKYI